MRALLTALIAAIEAVAIAVASLVIIAVPALLIWWLEFGLAAEPETLAPMISSIWFLGHLSPIAFTLDAETALTLGLSPEAIDVVISLAPLGLTLCTVLLAFRAGWRFAERGGAGIAGVIGGVVGFGVSAATIGVFGDPALKGELWIATLLAAACFAFGGLIAFVWRAAIDGHTWWHRSLRFIQQHVGAAGDHLPAVGSDIVRLTVAVTAAVFGLGALGFAVALVAGYVEIVTLSQMMQLDVLGVLTLFIVNLLLLPTACLWALAWFSGAGFSIGAGTWVSSFETLLGPIPALPIFGAIPQGWGWAGILAPLLIVLLGVLVGATLGEGLIRRHTAWVSGALIPLLSAVFAGAVVLGAAALATGSIGPGRMSENGPDALITAGLIAAELAAGLVIGVAARRIDRGRLSARLARRDNAAAFDAGETAEALASSTSFLRTMGLARTENAERAGGAERADTSDATDQRETEEITHLAEAETVPVEPINTETAAAAPSDSAAPTTPSPESETVPLEPLSSNDTPRAARSDEQQPQAQKSRDSGAPRASKDSNSLGDSEASSEPANGPGPGTEDPAEAYAWDTSIDFFGETETSDSEPKRRNWPWRRGQR